MNVKELKEKLEDLPDDMLVCGSGHFGEELEIYYAQVSTVSQGFGSTTATPALVIEMESAGEEPD